MRLLLLSMILVATPAAAADEPAGEPAERIKQIAGKAEVLRRAPKKFAVFQEAASDNSTVTLRLEGDDAPTTWPVQSDAEIRIRGWWGRLAECRGGDRVWVWFTADRQRQPKSVLMLADEISEQDIHNDPPVLEAVDPEQRTVVLKAPSGEQRMLVLAEGAKLRRLDDGFEFQAASGETSPVSTGDKVYAQTSGETVHLLLDQESLERLRSQQRDGLREIWREEGLPGTVTVLHPLGGEMEILLDHEAIRWGRALNTGDEVRIRTEEPIVAVVRHVRPWRERTLVRLVVSGWDQTDLVNGQRVSLSVPEPPQDVQSSNLPPDLDRPRDKDDRIEWFLSTVYCTCSVGGDGCTGMFYTQSSCNVNSCGMPTTIRRRVAALIDEGRTDRQILETLSKERGELLLKPHLRK